MRDEKKSAASRKSSNRKSRRSIASFFFSQGETESGIPNIHWEKHGLSLAEILRCRTLPCLVATDTAATVASLDVTQPLLLFSQSTASQVVASCVSGKTRGDCTENSEKSVVIPESYPGWFQVLQFPHQAPFFFESIQDVLRANCRKILIGGSDPVVCYRSYKDKNSQPLHRLEPGVVLTLRERSEAVFKRKANELVRRKGSKTEGEAFLQCVDEGGVEILLPLESRGTFFPVRDWSGSMSFGLVKMEDVVRRLQLPCTVRLVWGPNPASSRPFSDVLQLQGIRRQRVATLLTVFSGKDTIVSLADTSTLKFSVAREDANLKSDSRYRAAIRTCRQFSEDLETSIKVIKTMDLTHGVDRSGAASGAKDRKDGREVESRADEKSATRSMLSRTGSESGLGEMHHLRGLGSQGSSSSTDSLQLKPRSLPNRMDMRRSPTPTSMAKHLAPTAISPMAVSRSHPELSSPGHHSTARCPGSGSSSPLAKRATTSMDEEHQPPVRHERMTPSSHYLTMLATRPPTSRKKTLQRRLSSRSFRQAKCPQPSVHTPGKGHLRSQSDGRASPLLQFSFDPEDAFFCSSASTCSSSKFSDDLDDHYDKITQDTFQETSDDDSYSEVFSPGFKEARYPAHLEKTGRFNTPTFSLSPLSRSGLHDPPRKLSLPTDDRMQTLITDKGRDTVQDSSRSSHRRARRPHRSATMRECRHRREEPQLTPNVRAEPVRRREKKTSARQRQPLKRSEIYEPHVLPRATCPEAKTKTEKTCRAAIDAAARNKRDRGEKDSALATGHLHRRNASDSSKQAPEALSPPPPCSGARIHVYVNDVIADDTLASGTRNHRSLSPQVAGQVVAATDDHHEYAKLNEVLPAVTSPLKPPPPCSPKQKVRSYVNCPGHAKTDPDDTIKCRHDGMTPVSKKEVEKKGTFPNRDVARSEPSRDSGNYFSMIAVPSPSSCATSQAAGYVTSDLTSEETNQVDIRADCRLGNTSRARTLPDKTFLTGNDDTYVTYDPFGLLQSSSYKVYDPHNGFDFLGGRLSSLDVRDWSCSRHAMSNDFCDGSLHPPRRVRVSQLL